MIRAPWLVLLALAGCSTETFFLGDPGSTGADDGASADTTPPPTDGTCDTACADGDAGQATAHDGGDGDDDDDGDEQGTGVDDDGGNIDTDGSGSTGTTGGSTDGGTMDGGDSCSPDDPMCCDPARDPDCCGPDDPMCSGDDDCDPADPDCMTTTTGGCDPMTDPDCMDPGGMGGMGDTCGPMEPTC